MPAKYNPVPDVAPQLAPTQPIREDFPHVQFTGAVGEALSYVGRAGYGALGQATEDVGRAFDSLGKNVTGAGQEIFQRAIALKELESDKKVNDLTIKAYQSIGEQGEKFRSKLGENAGPDALTAHMKSQADLLKSLRDGLKTPYEQKKFDDETRGMFGTDVRQSVQHSATQVRNSLMSTKEAQISMSIDQTRKSQTQEEFDQHEKETAKHTRDYGHIAGWTPEQLDHNMEVNLSKGRVSFIANTADSEPVKAMQMLEANKDQILASDYENAKKQIQDKIDVSIGRNAADRAMQDPNTPLAEQEDKAKKNVAEANGSREAEDKAIQNVRREFTIKQQAKVDQSRKDKDTINDWLAGHLSPDGKVPTKEEEAGILPDVKAAWERLGPTGQKPFLKALMQNSKEDYVRTPATVTRFDQLMGMSYNPEKMNEFRDMDIMSEKIPMADKKELLARRREIAAKGQDAMDNPKVERVIGVLKADGELSKEFQQDSTTMDTFRGKVHSAIQKYEADKRGPSTDEEKLKIGRTLLKEVQGTGWFGSNVGAQRVFEKMGVNAIQDIPISWAKQYRESGTYKDDETMLNDYAKWYFIKQYDKLFGGRPVSEGTIATTGKE
jgi:aspartate-semialdehyde dehydrogenase